MKNGRNERFSKLRFFCFIGTMAFCLMTSLGPASSEGAESGQLGELHYVTLDSKEVGVSYRIGIATPPGYNESGAPYPAIFTLDGGYYLQTFREAIYDSDSDIIVVAIINSERRNRDYMPSNQCTPDGGGNDTFLNFLVLELVPYLDENYNINPSLRVLFGHSHGGSFVFYTLFSDHGETFPLLLSTDASIGCNLPYFQGLEGSYRLTNNHLPVVLYAAGATEQNAVFVRPYMQKLMSRGYQDLVAKYVEFQGSHDGILGQALSGGFDWLGSQIDYTDAPNKDIVEDFVTRFYQLCLDRSPDPTGLNGWVIALLDGARTGGDVAYGFVFSQEFTNKNTTDEEYLSVLYEAFFNRSPDEAGKQGWLDALANGASRKEVLDGFIFAVEFAELCDEYGIKAYEGHTSKAQREVEAFVTRFYNLCLDRDPDPAGLEGWTNNLLNQIQTGADVANGFIFSQEFINKNTSNDEYLTILYKAFFNRDPDQDGWDVWLAELNSGQDRGYVLNGFLGSQEFIKLCENYGIKPL